MQICMVGDVPPVVPSPVVVLKTAAAHPFGIRGALEFGRLVRETRPDIVHCAHFPTPMPVGRPLVVTLHDLTPLVVDGVLPWAFKRSVYRRWNARAARLADRIIAPSCATAEDIVGLFAVAQDKVVVVPEAADDFSSGQVGPLPAALAEWTAQPYLLSMGNTKPHKDLPTLLQAFSRVASLEPDLRLLLVGTEPPGHLRTALADASPDTLGRVTFTGPVDDDGLRALYAGALAFVFPSRHEGFGLPPLEAMAFGAPVVCADAASLPEVFGQAAVMFPTGDVRSLVETLQRILHDPALRRSLSSAGRDHAAHFTWERTAAATIAVYRGAMQTFATRHGRRAGGTE